MEFLLLLFLTALALALFITSRLTDELFLDAVSGSMFIFVGAMVLGTGIGGITVQTTNESIFDALPPGTNFTKTETVTVHYSASGVSTGKDVITSNESTLAGGQVVRWHNTTITQSSTADPASQTAVGLTLTLFGTYVLLVFAIAAMRQGIEAVRRRM